MLHSFSLAWSWKYDVNYVSVFKLGIFFFPLCWSIFFCLYKTCWYSILAHCAVRGGGFVCEYTKVDDIGEWGGSKTSHFLLFVYASSSIAKKAVDGAKHKIIINIKHPNSRTYTRRAFASVRSSMIYVSVVVVVIVIAAGGIQSPTLLRRLFTNV